MQYGEILKKAWSITLKYKRLWWLGLFAGVGGASANFNSGSNNWSSGLNGNGSSDFGGLSGAAFDSLWRQLTPWIPFLILLVVLIFLIWLAILIVQIAARGGLITQVDAAEREVAVSAGRGWGDGFHRWWPMAWMFALIALPFLVVMLIFAIALFGVVAVPLMGGGTPSIFGVLGVVFGFVGIFLLLIPVGIVLGVLSTLAQREIMLADAGPWESLTRSWAIVRHRFKDVALMWLVMVGVGLGFGLALFLLILVIVVPIAIVLVAGGALGALKAGWAAAVPVIIIGVLAVIVLWVVLAVVGAAYATWHSAAWTLFWRRVTGRQIVPPKQTAADQTAAHINQQQWQPVGAPEPPVTQPGPAPAPPAPPAPEPPVSPTPTPAPPAAPPAAPPSPDGPPMAPAEGAS